MHLITISVTFVVNGYKSSLYSLGRVCQFIGINPFLRFSVYAAAFFCDILCIYVSYVAL